MAYKALYRTYRPQTFEEVAGQQHIVKTLQNALKTGKIAHAYLFAGPRGTGKTSMAKIFAKALNCEEGIGCQCNKCKNCLSIIDGSHPDVLELDAASNNGVDEIRDLIDKVKYGTILGRYKVYIIDEVHMLSTGAFNALLKTLEEPPEHVIFILATTEPHKILPTILSRCQRYDFEKVSDYDIKERLKIVLYEEGAVYEEEALDLIIKLADGGVRDALSILEKVLAYSGNTLNVEDILNIFSLESTEEKMSLLKSIAKHDVKDVLDRLHKYVSSGSDIKRLSEDLLSILKDIVIYNSSYNATYLETLKEDEVQDLSNYIDVDLALKMIDILMGAIKDYKNVNSIIPLFEITLLKMSSINDQPIERRVNSQINQEVKREEPVKKEPIPTPTPEVKKEEKEVVEYINKEPEQVEETKIERDPVIMKDISLNDSVIYFKPADVEGDYFEIDDEMMINVMVCSKKEIKNEMIEDWKNIKKFVSHPVVGKAATLLLDARPLVASNKIVILEYQLEKAAEKINLKSNQLELQTTLSQVFGRKMFIYAVSRNRSVKLQNDYKNMQQLGQLPKAKDVVLEFEGE